MSSDWRVNEHPPRSVIKEPRFDAEAAAICPDAQWLDRQLRDPELLLAIDPDFGLTTIVPAVRIAPLILALPDGSTVEVDLYYTFDDSFVRFLSCQPA